MHQSKECNLCGEIYGYVSEKESHPFCGGCFEIALKKEFSGLGHKEIRSCISGSEEEKPSGKSYRLIYNEGFRDGIEIAHSFLEASE